MKTIYLRGFFSLSLIRSVSLFMLFFLCASNSFGGTWIIWCFSGNPNNCYSRWVPQNLDCQELSANYPRNNPDPAVGVYVADCWHGSQAAGMVLQEGFDTETQISFQIIASDDGIIFINEKNGKSEVLVSRNELNNIPLGQSLYFSEQDGLIIMYENSFDILDIVNEGGNVVNLKMLDVKSLLVDKNLITANLYPNPVGVGKSINFEIFDTVGSSKYNLEIIDMSGRTVMFSSIVSGINIVDIGTLSSGVYSYRLLAVMGESLTNGKFIVE